MSQSITRSNDISALDSLRAFAALSVCLYHFVCTTTDFIPKNGVYHFFENGRFGVHMFFVISGFVIPWSMYHNGYQIRHFFRFLLKRFARLEPPYLLSVLLALMIVLSRSWLVGGGTTHIELSGTQFLLHIGYLIPFFDNYSWMSPVYWTLAIEFQYYFLVAFAFLPIVKYGLIGRIAVYLLFVSSSYLIGSSFLPFWLPIFLIGIVLFLFKVQKITVWEFLLLTLILSALSIDKYSLPSLFFILSPVLVVVFYSHIKVPILHFCGKMSYSIYLIHPLIGASVLNLISHHTTTVTSKVLACLGVLLLTIFSSYIFYLIVEKPSKALSSRISYRK